LKLRTILCLPWIYSEFLTGKCFFNLIPDNQRDQIIQSFNSILFEAIEPELIKINLKNEQDESIDFEINSTVLKDHGKITGVLCIARDVTETNLLLEKERELEYRLLERHQLALIGKMIHGIAHNINTPLATIIGLSELIQIKFPDVKELKTINEQGLIISDIIKNMSRKVEHEESMKPELWDINYIIQEELEFFRGDNIFKHQITKEIDLQKNLPRINIRYQHFSQAFDAIMENAIEAMEKSDTKSLIVKSFSEDNHVIVKVSDSGIGFDEHQKKELFNPFFTTKNSNGNHENLGLGLYNAKLLLTPYGITIEAQRNNEITDVIIKIPVHD
jgi:two-component system NtrC family sensor kinase